MAAERVEAKASNTSTFITAIAGEMREDKGIQSADEFINDIPATTRDDYDIRILGVARDSIGGAINYILKKPTETPYGLIRAQFGSNSNQEFYGVASGPVTEDLGVRLVAADRQTDPLLDSVTAGSGMDIINDSNVSLSVAGALSDTVRVDARVNQRNSNKSIGGGVLINEGWGTYRGTRMTDVYAQDIRLVDATNPGAQLFTNPYRRNSIRSDQSTSG